MQGFQLWVNLPAKDKMTAPRYQDIAPERIPEVQLAPGAKARVIVGEQAGVRGPVENVATDPLYLDLHLKAGASAEIDIPSGHNGFVYVYEGQAKIGEGAASELLRGDLGVLSRGDGKLHIAAPVSARAIIVAGRPLNEPVAKYGPFVMNTQHQIIQAVEDFRAGRF